MFGDGRDVSYPTFLSWATPGPDGLAASGSRSGGGGGQRLRPAAGAAALAALEGGDGRGGLDDENTWNWKQRQRRLMRQQLQGGGSGGRDGGGGARAGEEEQEEEEAELKVRTALRKMGVDGVSRAWEEFERMDPGGRRGGVREEELVEVSGQALNNAGCVVRIIHSWPNYFLRGGYVSVHTTELNCSSSFRALVLTFELFSPPAQAPPLRLRLPTRRRTTTRVRQPSSTNQVTAHS